MILNIDAINKVYIVKHPIDFRKSINGLASIARYSLRLDIFNQNLIIFTNRRRNQLKLLYWDGFSFWLFLRRLEEGTYKWLTDTDAFSTAITKQQLIALIEDLEVVELQ